VPDAEVAYHQFKFTSNKHLQLILVENHLLYVVLNKQSTDHILIDFISTLAFYFDMPRTIYTVLYWFM